MATSSSNFYQLGASLPVDAQSYVRRQADEEFYQKLRARKFCYVLNSRQMGKSSLRVQTMQRLQLDGTICAAIDLTGIGKYKVTLSQWYGGIVYGLVESCQLEDKFNFDWQTWWQKKQSILDPVTCLRLFIEEVLLEKIQQPIVIFVDEIDRVLSQDFSLDDFFALIRFFQNQRVDNPIFERLTFALLGVATPSDLITDKTQTPFNIGEGIELHGFRFEEVQPLINGLQGKVSNPQKVMESILDWTGGQPFLTQKLCKFIVEESVKDNPRDVKEVVESRIIENWESQDDPEHLRTIRDRILSHGQKASYLLELYQLLRGSGEIASNNSVEVSELQLSGLVVKRQEKLRVYNRIYQQIFDEDWIETQLKNLRPYAEIFRIWVDSGGSDESRLLRGKALQEAEEWAKDKSLGYQDKQFLAASKHKEIQEKIAASEQEAALERERKDKEAAESRNQLLSKANKKAQRQIRAGVVVLAATVIGAVTVGLLSGKQLNETHEEVDAVQKLNKFAGELENRTRSNSGKDTIDYNEAFRLSALSFNIHNHQLKQALVLAASSQAELQLGKLKEAETLRNQSQQAFTLADKQALNSPQGLQIQVLFDRFQGSFLAQKKETIQEAIKSYSEALNILKAHPTETDFTKNNQLITGKNIESVHRELISLLDKNNTSQVKRKSVEESLTQHLYTELENDLKTKNWRAADIQTYYLMLNIAKREEKSYLDYDNSNSFSCPALKRIDQLWLTNSDNRFGFSVQKKIWIQTGNRLGIKPENWTSKDEENYIRFATAVGWYNDKKTRDKETVRLESWVSYEELIAGIKSHPLEGTFRGTLPELYGSAWGMGFGKMAGDKYSFLSRVATCQV